MYKRQQLPASRISSLYGLSRSNQLPLVEYAYPVNHYLNLSRLIALLRYLKLH